MILLLSFSAAILEPLAHSATKMYSLALNDERCYGTQEMYYDESELLSTFYDGPYVCIHDGHIVLNLKGIC